MKNIIIMLICLASTSILSAQTMDKVNITVKGLGCPFCAYGLEKKFKDVTGIKDIKIEMETGLMTFSVPATNKIMQSDIESRITKAGYTAEQISIKRADGKVENSVAVKAETSKLKNLANAKNISFKVYGNCDMCKARIEKTANALAGVEEAIWDKKTKQLKVKLDEQKTSLADLHQAIAKAGHDTDKAKANNDTYKNLPPCCLYKRSK